MGRSVYQLESPLAAERQRARSVRALRRRLATPAPMPILPLLLAGGCVSVSTNPPAPIPAKVSGSPDAINATAGGGAVTTLADGGSSVLANDTVTGSTDKLTVTAVATGSGSTAVAGTVGQALTGGLGTLVIGSDGGFTFFVADNEAVRALAAGETAVNRFSYTPSAGSASDTPQVITVTVTGINDPPVALADSASITEAVGTTAVTTISGSVRANDSDPDNGTARTQLSVTTAAAAGGSGQPPGSAIAGKYGTITISADGSYLYTLDNANPAVEKLSTGDVVTDVFSYTIADPQGLTATATLTITVNGVNDVNTAPVALPDTAILVAASTPDFIAGNLRGNDSDGESPRALLTISDYSTAAGAHGTLAAPLAGKYGTLTVNADGTFVYTLDNSNTATIALDTGQTEQDVFNYTLGDPQGLTAATTLTINISGVDDAPNVTGETATFIEDVPSRTTITANLLSNDYDPEGKALSIASLRNSSGGTLLLDTPLATRLGTLQVGTDGSYSFTVDNTLSAVNSLPAGGSASATFNYFVADPAGQTTRGTLQITVLGTNDAPVGFADFAAVQEDVTLTASGKLLANDRDPDSGAVLSVDRAEIAGGPLTRARRASGRQLRLTERHRRWQLHLHAQQQPASRAGTGVDRHAHRQF